jgi:hypothetical protein
MKSKKSDTKRIFLKKGTCSRTFIYILNREFGHPNKEAEAAADPLCGGLAQEGYQCGMLWGAALGVGAESFRRNENEGNAIANAINATRIVLESFIQKAKSANCSVITNCDFNGAFALVKFLITGKPLLCFNLADKWAPEAIEATKQGLSSPQIDSTQTSLSCASEVVRKMGGSKEEIVMTAGFAGGLGLSGNACGALGAAIWYKTLLKVREGNYKYSLNDTSIEKIKDTFFQETNYKIECSKICGRQFNSVNEHTEFINGGGCRRIIDLLGSS